MHTMQEYMNRIMYGDGNHAYCACKSINYSDYYKNDHKQTKEVAERMNKIRKTNDPRVNNYNTSNIYAVINGKAYAPEMIRMIRIDQAVPGYEFTIEPNPMYAVVNTMFSIKDVIFNPPATIVFWGDGSKTVVKCQNEEEFDPEKGLTMAFFKRMHDNKGRYFEEIKKWTNKYYDKYPIGDDGVTIEIHGKDWIDIYSKIKNMLNPLFTNTDE